MRFKKVSIVILILVLMLSVSGCKVFVKGSVTHSYKEGGYRSVYVHLNGFKVENFLEGFDEGCSKVYFTIRYEPFGDIRRVLNSDGSYIEMETGEYFYVHVEDTVFIKSKKRPLGELIITLWDRDRNSSDDIIIREKICLEDGMKENTRVRDLDNYFDYILEVEDVDR